MNYDRGSWQLAVGVLRDYIINKVDSETVNLGNTISASFNL